MVSCKTAGAEYKPSKKNLEKANSIQSMVTKILKMRYYERAICTRFSLIRESLEITKMKLSFITSRIHTKHCPKDIKDLSSLRNWNPLIWQLKSGHLFHTSVAFDPFIFFCYH